MNTTHPTGPPDPYTVLGLDHDATAAEITAAYRHAVRDCHPDAPHPNRDRLAAVIAAYRQLRRHHAQQPTEHHQHHPSHRRDIPVRTHRATSTPDLRAGPTRRHLHRG